MLKLAATTLVLAMLLSPLSVSASPWLYYVCEVNPFTHAVELIRFAFYENVEWTSLAIVSAYTSAFLVAAILAYDPGRGMLMRRGG